MTNNRELCSKRLLILGGQQKLCDIVLLARQMGVYTIVTDWYEDSPAKKIADKAYLISTSDVDAIVQLIRDEEIDGVITGYIDSTLTYFYEICKRAKLPCYLNQKILECCTNKRKFKELCTKLGIETIPEVDLNHRSQVDYPILIKPVDNSGSKGITVCYEEAMVDSAVERALRFSRSKAIVAERFLVCDYVAAYYTVQNGNVMLSLLMDKDMNRVARGIVPYPTALTAPSRYYERFVERIHPQIVRLVQQLDMQNGTFEIGFFVNGNHYYAVELTARLTATREYLLISEMLGMDTLEMHINFALSGQFTCSGQQENILNNKAVYCMLFCFIKEGTIGKIEGIENLRRKIGVLNVLQTRNIGAKIRADGSYGQLFAKIYLKADSFKDMVDLVNEVQDSIQVYSTENRPMIVTGFDAEKFFF